MSETMHQEISQQNSGFLKLFFQQGFHRWLKRRIPANNNIQLNHGNVFILPSKQGLGFCVVLAMMFIGAINYEASLAFALVFLLLSMFLLTILYTFRNLSGLTISSNTTDSVFAGSNAKFNLVIERRSKQIKESIVVKFIGSYPVTINLIKDSAKHVSLLVPVNKRGYFRPGRLTVETFFPFGLCRAWSLLDLDCETLVFPQPIKCDLDWILSLQSENGRLSFNTGNDDFHGLREYQHGDSLKHVAWKNFARGQGMFTKQYSSNVDERIWLRWEMFPDMDIEERLSRLCFCILELDARNVDYGLILPGIKIIPAKGTEQYQRTLTALAAFGLQAPEESGAKQ